MSVLKNLNYIKQASYFPCVDPNPVLILEAAFKAAAPVLMSAATFGCSDIVKMRAGISPWHSRGLKALINGALGPEKHNEFSPLLKYTIPIEKALFFWFVVDLTVDFFATWQSQIFKLGGCGAPPAGCNGSASSAVWVCPHAGATAPISYPFTTNGGGACGIAGTGFIVPAGWYFSAHFSITTKPIFHGIYPSSVTLELKRSGAGAFSYKAEPATPPWFYNDITASMLIEPDEPLGTFAAYEFTATADTICQAHEGSAVVQISPVPVRNRGIVPMNCLGHAAPGSQPYNF